MGYITTGGYNIYNVKQEYIVYLLQNVKPRRVKVQTLYVHKKKNIQHMQKLKVMI